MLKKEITYKNYHGVETKKVCYFNINRLELIDWPELMNGKLIEDLAKIEDTKDVLAFSKIIRELILKSYGRKSEDGDFFEKSEEISKAFSQSAAYEALLNDMLTKEGEVIDFLKGILPDDLRAQISQMNVK